MALSAIGLGGGIGMFGMVLSATVPIVAGALGTALGLAYMMSPSWKLAVVTDDACIEVRSGETVKFRLAWSSIVKVVAATSSPSAFVDGGAPERSLLIPGDGAPAPYQIENAAALIEELFTRIAPERIERVESLDAARPT